MGPDGSYYVLVGLARAEVDRTTYESLEVGETVRLRYTRANKAVNIDRFTEGNTHISGK